METKSRQTSIFAGLVGLIAAGASLAVGEVLGTLFDKPSPVVAVGNQVVNGAPEWFVNFGKAIFGLADKPALIAGTAILTIAFGGLLGRLAYNKFRYAVVGLDIFGIISLLALGTDSMGGWLYAVLVTILVVLTAGIVLWWGIRMLRSSQGNVANKVSDKADESDGAIAVATPATRSNSQ